MKRKFYPKFTSVLVAILLLTSSLKAQEEPTITGPAGFEMPETVSGGITTGVIYFTEPGQTGYDWNLSAAGAITAGNGTDAITVTWTNPTGQQFVSVSYGGSNVTTLIINYFPFAAPIDPFSIPQFIDPLPHFAAGLRVNAKTVGNLKIKTKLVQQVALPTGMTVANGTIGVTPNAGKGYYAAYQISADGGKNWGPAMWPAQTIETKKGHGLLIAYENGLFGVRYDKFNILADQTLMMNGYDLTGDPLTDPYTGDIPMVVHLHEGEVPSASDGGPNSWFTPGFAKLGPAFQHNASSNVTYPNLQDESTAWYHPHDDGLTRINVYTGLAGFYLIRGPIEEAAQLPGWSGDGLVREVTPDPLVNAPTFNGSKAYLPEIEIAIQDRMFDVNGQLYWPVDPPNPELHPFWTPEFVGDIMTVNGKTWPYLSVAPRKYRFRLLDGCNARWLNLWLADATTGSPGPAITVVGGDGGLLASPVTIDPAAASDGTLLIGPGQRYDIVIDFTNFAGGKFILMNDAGAPYPGGDPVTPGTTDRIMQFVVNGVLVGADNSKVPVDLRAGNPLVQLTDFNGNLTTGVKPKVKRQLILNEVIADGGPAAVQINNMYFEAVLAVPGSPYQSGGPTEFMEEGTTELIQIANVSADAHPMHIHLLSWQLVSRQPIDDIRYLDDYALAWENNNPNNLPNFPEGMEYPGGGGPPYDYNIPNTDGALGGNPPFSGYLNGAVQPALPEEMGWKDNTTALPGMVSTFVVRVAPTDIPIDATPAQLLLPFDPSLGPGYVWHCHIIDHEDMSMMRPLIILPSPLRFPQITTQPVSKEACIGDVNALHFSVAATSATNISYQWEISTDGGLNWTPLADNAVYTGSLKKTLKVMPANIVSGTMYHCLLTNVDGTTTSDPATLTVNDCSITGTLKYNNLALDPLAGFTISVNGKTAVTDALGAFTIPAVTSGTSTVKIKAPLAPGGINSSDAGSLKSWIASKVAIPNVRLLSGDVNNDLKITEPDAVAIENKFVKLTPFMRTPWVFWDATGSGVVIPPTFKVTVNGAPVTGLDILAESTGDFNGSFDPNANTGNSLVVLTPSFNTLTFPLFKLFELPLKTVTDLQTGAISLILNVPSKLVKVIGVTVPGSNQAVTWKTNGNELRIGWNSLVPVSKAAGDNLVILHLLPTLAFTDLQTLILELVPNSLNEIADQNFEPIINAELKVDQVVLTPLGIPNAIKLKAEPNPATVNTTVTYILPVAGKVNLGIYNVLGTPVSTLVSNVTQNAGTYTLITDISSLRSGIYYIRITLSNKTQFMVKAIILVKK